MLAIIKLEPAHYYTSPGLSWDATLKTTKIHLELMTDINMFQFIGRGLRGGISYIANRYALANNKNMKDYDETKPSKYITYLDANNLYGFCMSSCLPTGGFRWFTDKEIKNLNLDIYTEDSEKGMILEVDLEYPERLHNSHNDFSLTAEKLKVNKSILSPYCEAIRQKYNITIRQVHKLILTLTDKEKYVLHYRNLQLYLSLGLKLKKIHRVLTFN